jgi:hypothetical protein
MSIESTKAAIVAITLLSGGVAAVISLRARGDGKRLEVALRFASIGAAERRLSVRRWWHNAIGSAVAALLRAPQSEATSQETWRPT